MKNFKIKFQALLGYTNYEMAIFKYFFLTILSEGSKLLICTLFWLLQEKGTEFYICFCLFTILRTCSGGLHLKHYIPCFIFSFFYFVLCINILPLLSLAKWIKLCLLFVAMLLAYYFTPVVSIYRPLPQTEKIKKSKCQLFIIIFIFFIMMYIMQPNILLDICFWCIILHTIQLFIAYKIMERRYKCEKKDYKAGK